MSFDDLTPQKRQAGSKVPIPARVGMRARGLAPARMAVTLHADTLKIFGGAKNFRIGCGKAEDKHLLRIAADTSGLFELMKLPGPSKIYFVFLLPAVSRFPNCRIESQEVKFEIEGKSKALLITLPGWAWNENSKREMEQLARPAKKLKAAA